MAKKTTKPNAEQYRKPYRMVRLPEALAVALEAVAEERFASLTDEVRTACVARLESLGRMPKPPAAGRPPKS